MKREGGAAALLIATWAGGADAQPPALPPPVPPLPPIIRPALEILSYPDPASAVVSTNGAVRAVSAAAAPPTVWAARPPMVSPVADRNAPPPQLPPPSGLPAYSFLFNVTTEGRPVSIRRDPPPAFSYDTGDHAMLATIAAWRFQPGRARSNYRYAAAPRRTPLEQAPRNLALQLMSETRPGLGREEVVRRAAAPGSDCRPRPNTRVQAYPAFETLPGTPGRREWVALGHDIDAEGRPQRAEVLASSGSSALDTAGADALRRSQYQPGARRGCLYWYWRSPLDLPPPPRPALSAFVRPGDDCPNTDARNGRVKFTSSALNFPPAFRERNITGWAIVRYDVASWGQVGPPEVVAAVPAAAFGQAAQNLIRTGRADAGPGWRGCLQTVVFNIADEVEEPAGPDLPVR